MGCEILRELYTKCQYSGVEINTEYFESLMEDDINPNELSIKSIINSKKMMIELLNLYEKQIQIEKSKKESAVVRNQAKVEINEMLRTLVDSHHYQIQIFKFLWVINEKKKTKKSNSLHKAPDTYTELLHCLSKNEQIFSPIEIENYKAFNILRNYIAHTPTQIVIQSLCLPDFDQIIELMKEIEKTSNMAIEKFKKNICIIIKLESIKRRISRKPKVREKI